MARALIVGCGCSGRLAGSTLRRRGWAVRGSSRTTEGQAAIEAAGIEAVIADPDRVGTIIELLGDVTVLIWALGSARGAEQELAALHGPRLERTLEKIVDTPVRGFVYEVAGTVPAALLGAGAELVAAAGERWRIPTVAVQEERDEGGRWATAIADAAEKLVGI